MYWANAQKIQISTDVALRDIVNIKSKRSAIEAGIGLMATKQLQHLPLRGQCRVSITKGKTHRLPIDSDPGCIHRNGFAHLSDTSGAQVTATLTTSQARR